MLASRCALLARLLLALLVRPGHAWLVLPIQSLHGASFGLNWAIGVATAHRLAPPALQASAQGAVATAGVLAGSLSNVVWSAAYEAGGAFAMVSLGFSSTITKTRPPPDKRSDHH